MDFPTTPAADTRAPLREMKLAQWRGVKSLMAAGIDDPDNEGVRARIEELAILFTMGDREAGLTATFLDRFGDRLARIYSDAPPAA